ncbi:MAG: multicomponent Na+:H+ antiporter subunit [Bacillota bacterium]|nr:multicomponent Na+:H+ antiporter subunit [Bacillota bacterium]MDK2926099.1 multicomponent Na+:H+ antiporter subunit [Bacillota bacterium]MDK2960076.1 multicomponent Na+:H+ antiporter subunit [Bacillota bacterium]
MQRSLAYELPLLGEGLSFQADALGLFFALLTLWVWFWATLFSFSYLAHAHDKPRFYTFWFLTLAGCLGAFLAADLFTLYFFFELMSLSSWALVIHEEDFTALSAGNAYLYLSLAGGLAILAAAFLLQGTIGTTSWQASPPAPPPPAGTLAIVAALLFAGFGLKAGLFPLHFWLPQTHPVAPAPASAVLSGILLKVGAYGLLRTVSLLASWHFFLLPAAGALLAALATFTMLLGAQAALRQQNAKRLLAYSSVSQLGYVALGVAIAALLGRSFPLVWVGTLYHTMNHALAKSALFLSAGALGRISGSLELNAATALGLKYRGLGAAVVLGAAAMAGLPGLSGYISKTLLHHAVVAAPKLAGPSWRLLEPFFVLAGAGTAAYYLVLIIPWFTKSKLHVSPDLHRASPLLWLPPLVLTLSTVAAGFLPGFFLSHLVIPSALALLGEEAHHLKLELEHFHPWSAADLKGAFFTLALGLLIYTAWIRGLLPRRRAARLRRSRLAFAVFFRKFAPGVRRAFSLLGHYGRNALASLLLPLATGIRKRSPDLFAVILRAAVSSGKWLRSVEKLADFFRPRPACRPVQAAPFSSADYFLSLTWRSFLAVCEALNMIDVLINQAGVALARRTLAFFHFTARIDEALENFSTSSARTLHSFLSMLGHLEAPPRPAGKAGSRSAGWERLLRLDLLNLDVAVLLLALLLIFTLLCFLLQI